MLSRGLQPPVRARTTGRTGRPSGSGKEPSVGVTVEVCVAVADPSGCVVPGREDVPGEPDSPEYGDGDAGEDDGQGHGHEGGGAGASAVTIRLRRVGSAFDSRFLAAI